MTQMPDSGPGLPDRLGATVKVTEDTSAGGNGSYLFLILLPLVTALLAQPDRVAQPFLVELAVGAGFVGFAIMAWNSR